MKRTALFFALVLLSSFQTYAGIIFHHRDATVWGQPQTIRGRVHGFYAASGRLFLNDVPVDFTIQEGDSSFAVAVTLGERKNTILVQVDSSGTLIDSQPLQLTLGYNPRPEIFAYIEKTGSDLVLQSQVMENPGDVTLTYQWHADERNPAAVSLATPADPSSRILLPVQAPYGEYYFNLLVVSSDGDSTRARTFLTMDEHGIRPFQIKTDHAAWINKAVLYEITPCIFVSNGKLQDIIDKIPELSGLGVTALWLQPTFGTLDFGGMGYGITDYFAVRSDIGTEADLRRLVASAHDHGLKVLLDMVPNHSYIEHPYALDAVKYGRDSHYYEFYQRNAAQFPEIPYSEFYYQHTLGFVYYFWDLLPNLNYDNPEVQRWMTEICRYWVEEFDIDGYRFDAVWGVNARKPEYTRQLRLALKRVKPEIMMLAEDKAPAAMVFDERFDVAFDWTADQSWVSQWSWQVNYSDYWQDQNATIFNSWQPGRGLRLRNALTNNGQGYHPGAKVLRFLENNDTQHFARHHSVEITKMAAALAFTLPGVPLIYNGQEIGYAGPHPYYGEPLFKRGASIRSLEGKGLFPYYQQLTALRKNFAALTSDDFEEVNANSATYVYAFRRWHNDEHIFVLLNMGNREETATLNLPVEKMHLDSTRNYYLSELLSDEVISGRLIELKELTLKVQKFTTKVFLLADSVFSTQVVTEPAAQIPDRFILQQNYPNPFNAGTALRFSLPRNETVRLQVYNLLGELVATLVDGYCRAGEYEVPFQAGHLASGVYLYRLEGEDKAVVKKMLLAK